jgi:hypothetical protein
LQKSGILKRFSAGQIDFRKDSFGWDLFQGSSTGGNKQAGDDKDDLDNRKISKQY